MLQPNYISNRIDHKFLPPPLIEVYYDLIKDDTIIGYYRYTLTSTISLLRKFYFFTNQVAVEYKNF